MAYAFPEQRFPPGRRFSGEYYARVQRGYEVAANASVAICGLARDIESGIPKLIEAVTAICDLFMSARIYLYENDSVDATRTKLQEWAASDPRIFFKSEYRQREKWGPVRSGVRADHMAEYRNVYHGAVAERGAPDYVIVLDTDLRGWSLNGIASTLGADHWDAMGSNGFKVIRDRLVQYDVWAWRDLDHPHAHPATEINPRLYDRGHPPVPILSCFGGLAVYQGYAFLAGRYSGGDCEHVLLHRTMSAAGFPRIFLNPGMVTDYGS